MTRIAALQLAPTIADLDANEEMSVAAVRRAVADGAELVVMPELTLSGYMLASQEEAQSVAITAEHPVFTAWASAVSDTNAVAVGGFAELGDGCVYNSAAVVDRSGVLAVYRKAHLWDQEKLIFGPGESPPKVVATPAGRLGVLICYDLEFPEMTRSLALAGADLIVVPTNWPLEVQPNNEASPEVTIAMAAAYTNNVGIICCDRSGTERGQSWDQGSCIINEQGRIIAATSETSGTAVAELDLGLARRRRHLFDDRRPELYGEVAAPCSPDSSATG